MNAHAKVGDVYVLQRHDDGRDAAHPDGHGQRALVIDATVGAGQIDVVRAAVSSRGGTSASNAASTTA